MKAKGPSCSFLWS